MESKRGEKKSKLYSLNYTQKRRKNARFFLT
jgi:hypothetical protein